MAFTNHLILRKPQSGCLEGRTGPIQPLFNFFTRFCAGITLGRLHRGVFAAVAADPQIGLLLVAPEALDRA